jgi:DNA-binding response OmpR family regulator
MKFLELSKKVGANQILGKPVRPEQLFAAIEALLKT